MASDRREFLKALGGLTAAAAAGTACDVVPPAPEAAGAAAAAPEERSEEALAARSYATQKFALELDGAFAGWLASTEGGSAVGEVVTYRSGNDDVERKQIGSVRYEDVTISCGAGMSKHFYEWIRDTLERQPKRKDGAIVAADLNLRERSRLEFQNALISELGMPALDAASKDAARMTLKFSPEITRSKKGSGSVLKYEAGTKGFKWSPSGFRLQIDGLDDATSRVSKIEALTIKQKLQEYRPGETRDPVKLPSGVEFPNLAVTLSEAHADGFYAWHQDFVIEGNSGQGDEKGGTLEYQDRRGQPLFTLTFQNLGVFKVAPGGTEANRDGVRRIKAEMYCEQISFSVGPGGD
jgi:phage tail-like protein